MDHFLRIEPTGQMVEVDGVPCRKWRGTTPNGGVCDVYVRLVGSADQRCEELLDEMLTIVSEPRIVPVPSPQREE